MTNFNELPTRIQTMIDAFIAYANDPIRLDPADFDDFALDRSYFDNIHPDYIRFDNLDTNRYDLTTIDDCHALKLSLYIECDIELIAYFDDANAMTMIAISTDTSPYDFIASAPKL